MVPNNLRGEKIVTVSAEEIFAKSIFAICVLIRLNLFHKNEGDATSYKKL